MPDLKPTNTLGLGRKTEELFQQFVRSTSAIEQLRAEVAQLKREVVDLKHDLEKPLLSSSAHLDNLVRRVDTLAHDVEKLVDAGFIGTLESIQSTLTTLEQSIAAAAVSETQVVNLLREQLDRIQRRESAEFEVIQDRRERKDQKKEEVWMMLKPWVGKVIAAAGAAAVLYLTLRFGLPQQPVQPAQPVQAAPVQPAGVAPVSPSSHDRSHTTPGREQGWKMEHMLPLPVPRPVSEEVPHERESSPAALGAAPR